MLELQGQTVSLSETLHINSNKQMSVATKGNLYQIIDRQIECLSIAHNELREGVEMDHGN